MEPDTLDGDGLDRELIAAIDGTDGADLTELVEAVDGDPATVFVRLRRLERDGAIESTAPGVYRSTGTKRQRTDDPEGGVSIGSGDAPTDDSGN